MMVGKHAIGVVLLAAGILAASISVAQACPIPVGYTGQSPTQSSVGLMAREGWQAPPASPGDARRWSRPLVCTYRDSSGAVPVNSQPGELKCGPVPDMRHSPTVADLRAVAARESPGTGEVGGTDLGAAQDDEAPELRRVPVYPGARRRVAA